MASKGVSLNCHGCGREVLLPYVGIRGDMVSITPIEGWTAPPLLCPGCSDPAAGPSRDTERDRDAAAPGALDAEQTKNLEELFATDIAIWLRVHADENWTAEGAAVRGLAQRLIRVVGGAS